MKNSKTTLAVPLLLIAVGIGWLLTGLQVLPEINWVWTVSLSAIGILVFALTGIDKFSVVTGPLFILASFLSILRQQGHLTLEIELPILVIWLGVLQLVVRHSAIPSPDWVELEESAQNMTS